MTVSQLKDRLSIFRHVTDMDEVVIPVFDEGSHSLVYVPIVDVKPNVKPGEDCVALITAVGVEKLKNKEDGSGV